MADRQVVRLPVANPQLSKDDPCGSALRTSAAASRRNWAPVGTFSEAPTPTKVSNARSMSSIFSPGRVGSNLAIVSSFGQ